ncbi:60_t:CDS:2 [Ambispora leptoticha]|uniref:60_t:CDS:1 n=1 Tax=Ambispora leptoticha TaxID=144679 RepID=A0A9N9BVA3_9GLOM|nr:60_t:CDS:2 [Ambispora leptoticha]
MPSRNIQEYINGLINKSTTFYLDLNNGSLQKAEHYNCRNCNQRLQGKLCCANCSQKEVKLTGEITDLKEFSNLRGINASNNKFENLNFLDTLPNKDKLKSLNLFGNQLKEIDFAELFTNFSNLEKINLENNPLSAKNLDNLTSEQFAKLVKGIKDKKIRVNSFKGTVLMDLLDYAQKLVKSGDSSQQQQAYQLQAILQNNPIKNEPQLNNSKLPWVIGGVAAISLAVIVGYFNDEWIDEEDRIEFIVADENIKTTSTVEETILTEEEKTGQSKTSFRKIVGRNLGFVQHKKYELKKEENEELNLKLLASHIKEMDLVTDIVKYYNLAEENKEKLKTIRQAHDALATENSQVKAQLTEGKNLINSQATETNDLKGQIVNLREENDVSQEQLTTELGKKDQRIKDLQAQIAQLERKRSPDSTKNEAEAQTNSGDLRVLQTELKRYKESYENLTKTNKNLNSLHEEAKKKKQEEEIKHNETQNENLLLKAEIHNLKTELAKLANQLKNSANNETETFKLLKEFEAELDH